jgi:hypothetical protein
LLHGQLRRLVLGVTVDEDVGVGWRHSR